MQSEARTAAGGAPREGTPVGQQSPRITAFWARTPHSLGHEPEVASCFRDSCGGASPGRPKGAHPTPSPASMVDACRRWRVGAPYRLPLMRKKVRTQVSHFWHHVMFGASPKGSPGRRRTMACTTVAGGRDAPRKVAPDAHKAHPPQVAPRRELPAGGHSSKGGPPGRGESACHPRREAGDGGASHPEGWRQKGRGPRAARRPKARS